jgi:hypothetical protein
MGNFVRKSTVGRKLKTGDLDVHTGLRYRKKSSVRPKPSGWFQRLIGVVFNKGKKE